MTKETWFERYYPDKATMDPVLSDFLGKQVPRAEEYVDWGNMPLRIVSYLAEERPPLAYVTSVRAVVLDTDRVLTIHDGQATHILPGGRRKPGEAVETTLRRELAEETGYVIGDAGPLGFMHYRHLGPKPDLRPDGYAYPFPISSIQCWSLASKPFSRTGWSRIPT